jgi:hypothetical protein
MSIIFQIKTVDFNEGHALFCLNFFLEWVDFEKMHAVKFIFV